MKVVYLGDNRTRTNWGCRATSIALQQLLEGDHSFESFIHEKEALGGYTPVFQHAFIPSKIISPLYPHRKRGIVRWIFKFYKNTGGKLDYLTENIDENVDFITKNQHKYPVLKDFVTKISLAEILIINGEGTFIYCKPARRDTLFYLTLAKLGLTLKKKVFILNTIFSDFPGQTANIKLIHTSIGIFKDCEHVTTRDKESLRYITNYGLSGNVTFIPDALFSWKEYFNNGLSVPVIGNTVIPFPEQHKYIDKFDFTKPYVCLGGSSTAISSSRKDQTIIQYVKIAKAIQAQGFQVLLVETCSGDNFIHEVGKQTNMMVIPERTNIWQGMSILGHAQAFVSGRFHPSILASLGGTPCIFFGSNSHKTRSLQELLEYKSIKEFNSVPSDEEIPEILKILKNVIHSGETERNRIKKATESLKSELKLYKKIIH